jgi:hypothetical protein
MLFQTSDGFVFNSIKLQHLKNRMGLSTRQYSFCIEDNGTIYVIGGSEDLKKCRKKSIVFSNKHHISVDIYYFARESSDNFIKKRIETINPKYNDRSEISNTAKNSYYENSFISDNRDLKDEFINKAQNEYLNKILNKSSDEQDEEHLL